ncbi:beta-ketoacyl-[acyl-carrier-protein] synthase family protein [Chromobacterium violaceum]|uniref:3-oxoacyl-[acyl-carrier-protein] synthase 2 n=1 Tax=Chromobacterium violaceum TaxID=536 RepID=A0AAX2MBU7_CHRVL|nr:beta-ketoacyl-[acyl-carrier-protein] synthase family protein [Chromobacterium violaceum]OLZ69066.1 3-oxoacyl-ACP synthase [Chromobacterium violaceum]STB71219.1 3-oxoacyl-[acyl-carrier-protein] synthase 2 [Chromobacterium violaceum]SUX33356.1 3-oxoacyl-[acyl-carrier-protein] synthase 2 [Chromobacterium violaceum]
MANRRVVVTGYGSLTSLGENSAEAWEAIMNGKLGYRKFELENQQIKAKFFSFLDENKARYRGIPKAISRALPAFAKNAVVAAREAIDMAFGSPEAIAEHYPAHECGVIIGTGWGGLDEAYDIRDAYRDTGFGSPLGSLISMPSIATGACTLMWNLRGYQNTVIAACATGTIAIGDAYEAIRQGRASLMLAGGSETLRNETNIWNIDVLNALSKEQEEAERACCPFDRRRSGFVLAEGAAVLCLEELEHAQHRGATILGEIKGYGSFSDARDFTAPAEDMLARVKSIEFALKQAGKRPEDIDYINAHGTSTPLNDLNESNAIKAALGAHAKRVPVSSTKSYSGHLISAAGSFESIICLKAIATGILPGTANLLESDPECDLNYLPNGHLHGQAVDTTLNLSFGFGGANAALVIERAR